ncbi:hypothetical protein ACRAKI_22605 [Saccharothrix isguenensis]
MVARPRQQRCLHTVRLRNGTWQDNELSLEMISLALDVACLGSAHIIGVSTMILTDMAEDAVRYRHDLLRQAVVVHASAQRVHGLD